MHTTQLVPTKEAAELGFSGGKLGVFRRENEAFLTHSSRSKFDHGIFAESFK